MKNVLFWFWQFTWGILDNLLGVIVFLILILKYKPKRFHKMIYFEIGGNWGGVNFGWVAIIGNYNGSSYKDRILRHEHGHFIQNLIFGPFEILIQAASAIRYWYREYLTSVKGKRYSDLPDYDSIWFEGQATKFGYKYLS